MGNVDVKHIYLLVISATNVNKFFSAQFQAMFTFCSQIQANNSKSVRASDLNGHGA
jgi:hypothetical protein